MQRLSKEAESKIASALDKIADLVDSGEHPTDAVVAAAKSHGLTANYAKLAAVAYNTGRSAVQRDSSSDTFGRGGEFELADPELIGQQLEVTKTAAAASDEVSDEYSRPPTFIREHHQQQKFAQVAIPTLGVKHGPLPKYAGDDFEKARGDAQRAQAKLGQCDQIFDRLCNDLDAGLEKFAAQLTGIYAPAVATLRKVAAIRGDANVSAVLSELCLRQPKLSKRAASSRVALSLDEQQAYVSAAELASAADRVLRASQAVESAKTAAAKTITEAVAPHVHGIVSRNNDPWASLNVVQEFDKRAAGVPLQAALGYYMGQQGGYPSNNDDQVEAHMAALDDPQQAQRLSAINARTAVEGLMASDPVLRGYHPDDVIESYNDIVQASPRVADQKLFLQSALRRHLAQGGSLDPADVRENIYGLDKPLREMQSPADIKPTQPIKTRDRLGVLQQAMQLSPMRAAKSMWGGVDDKQKQQLNGEENAAP